MADGAFTFQAQRVLTAAFTSARQFAHSCLCSEHLLLGLCAQRDDPAAMALESQGITKEIIEREILAKGGQGKNSRYTAEISREAADLLENAARIANLSENDRIAPQHILLAILRDGACSAHRMLVELGADMGAVAGFAARPPQQMARKTRSREPKLLLQHGSDMTQRAARGEYDRLVGRDGELERVMRVLCRRRKANPVLLGEAGVGKTAIAEGLATAIAMGKAPAPLKNMRVFSIDMATVVSGTKYRGEFEEKVRGIIDEACGCGDIILFIDELHTVAGAGAAEGAIDAGNILKPALARGGIRILGATTPAEYRKYIAKDAALERRFQPIDVRETDRSATMAILRSSAALCRRYYGVEAGEDALGDIERMCRRFLPQRYFPDKAIDVLDEASAMALTEGKRRIECGHIKKVVAQMSGLTSLWSPEGMCSPQELEKSLLSQVIGQDEAVKSAVSAVASAMAFPGGRGRPQGVMLFCGPSGTGKTLLAKKLAQGLFGQEKALLRFDMSEYREAHSVSRLIGAPPGYMGHGSGGALTEAIRRRPFSVLLFDEVEKAHPEVLNLLLQLLEDGVLTDSEGVTADFKNAVIIMTSNIGGKSLSGRRVGFAQGDGQSDLKNALSQWFSPELLGRIDRVVPFAPLDGKCLERIAQIELEGFRDRLAEEGVSLVWDEGVPEVLCRDAHDGRKVRAELTRQVEEPLALMCLENLPPRRVEIQKRGGGLRLRATTHAGV